MDPFLLAKEVKNRLLLVFG